MDILKYTFNQKGDERGNLVPVEALRDIPFEIRRIYYMFDTKEGVRRGYHSHKSLEQVLICINGSCKVLLDNGKERQIILLDKRHEGLYIGRNIWREMFDLSENAVLLVLASEYYNESDYIRDYDMFLKSVGISKTKKQV